MTVESILILVGAGLVLSNAIYLGLRRGQLAARYPGAELPAPLVIIWATLLIGSLSLYISQDVQLSPGRYQDPWLGIGVPPVGAVLASLGWLQILIDQRTRQLPNALSALLGVEIFSLWIATWILTGPTWEGLLAPLSGALLWAAPFVVARKGAVGRGDIKLAPILGFALGTSSIVLALAALVIAFVAAGCRAVWLRATGTSRDTRFAMGPYLIGAALFCWFGSTALSLMQ